MVGSENIHSCTQNTKEDIGFDLDFFLDRYNKDDNELVNHISRITNYKTQVSFGNVETG
jgi:hypothetical protein